MSQPRHATRLLTLGAIAGVLTRWAFGDGVGLGAFLWTAAVVLGFRVAGGREGWQRAKAAHGWLAAALFFSLMLALRDSMELTFFNSAAVVLLLLLAAQDATGANAERQSFLDGFADSMRAMGGTAQGSLAMLRTAGERGKTLASGTSSQTGALLRGLALATPVVLVLGALLVSGDGAFGSAVERLFDGAPEHALTVTSWVFWSLLAGLTVAGGWVYALRRRASPAAVAEAPARFTVGATEGLVVLGSVAALFTAFLVVQAEVLFFQDPSQRGTGLTYAAWARDGFFELSIVSALTWGLIELAQKRVRTAARSSELALRVGASAVVALTLVILLSAHLRLSLYDETYGFTVRRILAHATIVWLGLALVSRAVTLWVARTKTLHAMALSALAVLAGLDLMNPDAFVVRANLQRSEEVVVIDWIYLSTLSADAAPALLAAVDRVPRDWRGGQVAQARKVWGEEKPTLASLNLSRVRAAGVVDGDGADVRAEWQEIEDSGAKP